MGNMACWTPQLCHCSEKPTTDRCKQEHVCIPMGTSFTEAVEGPDLVPWFTNPWCRRKTKWKIDPRYLVVEKGFYIVSLLLSSPLSQTTILWSFTAELSNYSVYSHSPAHSIWLPCPSPLKMLKPVKISWLPNVVDMLVCTGPLCSISTYEQPPSPEISSRALLLV